MRGSLKAYKTVAVHSQQAVATPYQTVKMLLAGVLERLARAKAAIEQQQPAVKGEQISSAIAIISELQAALDINAGGEIAANLDNLYDFANRELLQANLESDIQRVDMISNLIRQIKEAWDAIPSDQQNIS